jgi:hypothetical protein
VVAADDVSFTADTGSWVAFSHRARLGLLPEQGRVNVLAACLRALTPP